VLTFREVLWFISTKFIFCSISLPKFNFLYTLASVLSTSFFISIDSLYLAFILYYFYTRYFPKPNIWVDFILEFIRTLRNLFSLVYNYLALKRLRIATYSAFVVDIFKNFAYLYNLSYPSLLSIIFCRIDDFSINVYNTSVTGTVLITQWIALLLLTWLSYRFNYSL
jgi:hypothetical protein